MEKRKSLYSICFVVVLLALLEFPVWAGQSTSKTIAPEGWPGQVGKRKVYPAEYGYVYASSESSAAKINKIVLKVLKDLDGEGMMPGARGLVLVMDKKEEPPFEAEKLLTILARQQSEKEGQNSKKALEALEDGKKEMEELGLDMNFILSIAPMPIEPNVLPELFKGFPKDVNQQIEWCMTIPTESNIQYGFKKVFKAGMKKEKVGIVKQVALFPILAFAENKAISELKKVRRLALYQCMVEKQDQLTDKQKQAKVKAYEEKL